MFERQLYEPNSLHSMYHSSLPQNLRSIQYKPSSSISERQLLLSILYLLQNLPRAPFELNASTDKYQVDDRITMQHLSEGSVQNIIKRVLETANKLLQLRKNCQILQSNANPQVKSFSHGVQKYIGSTDRFYAHLLERLQKQSGTIPTSNNEPENGVISVLTLQLAIEKRGGLLDTISRSVNNVIKTPMNQIVVVLNNFMDLVEQYSNYPGQQIQQFYKVFLPALKHQVMLIRDWLKVKVPIQQTGFFIRQPLKDQKTLQSQSFFHHANPIFISALPNFFKPYARSILHLGKTIQYILLFYSQADQYQLMQYFDIDAQFQSLLRLCTTREQEREQVARKTLRKQKTTINSRLKMRKLKKFQEITVEKDNPYQMFPTTKNAFFMDKISRKEAGKATTVSNGQCIQKFQCFNVQFHWHMKRMLKVLSEKCIRLFKKGGEVPIKDEGKIRKEMNQTLKGIRQFMLYGQGDFFQQLITLIYETMERPMNMISSNLVNSYIEQAKNTSNAKEFPEQMLQNVAFFYLKNPQKALYIKGWHNFSMLYKPRYPTNYIFTSKVMQNFGQIFNFLFQLKKCEFTIKNIWADYRRRNNLHIAYLGIRNSIHTLLNGLISHIMIQIELQWNQFIDKFQDTRTILEIIDLTHRMIHNLMKITVSEKSLVDAVESLMDLVDRFKKSSQFTVQRTLNQQKEVQRFRYDLRLIVETIIRIESYKQIIDFNDFYAALD